MAKLLIIDDDRESRDMLEIGLKDKFSIETCSTTNEALIQMDCFRPDMVIVEILMQEESGLEFIFKLKKRHDKTKVVAVTKGGRISPLFYQQIMDALGVAYFLHKPLQLNNVEFCLKSLCLS